MKKITEDAVSIASLEVCLDRLAREIEAFGTRGRALLPMYARLENELAALQAEEDTMSRVIARLKSQNPR